MGEKQKKDSEGLMVGERLDINSDAWVVAEERRKRARDGWWERSMVKTARYGWRQRNSRKTASDGWWKRNRRHTARDAL